MATAVTAARTQRQMSRQALAEQAGISLKALEDLERGYPVPHQIAAAVCRNLDLPEPSLDPSPLVRFALRLRERRGQARLSRAQLARKVGASTPIIRSLETASRNKLFEVGTGLLSGSNYQAFSPDGQYLVTTEAAGLTVRDGTAGTIFGNNPALTNANMPDFSPDGKTVVFARSAMWCPFGPCTLSTTGASLFTAEFKGAAGFGPARSLLASAGENNYYPSFSPDGRYVAFNRAGGDSYDAADARVMVVAAAGGTPIDLTSVNGITGNSWPKWSPFLHRFGSGSITCFIFFYQWTYPVALAARRNMARQAIDNFGKPFDGHDAGVNRLASGWHFVETANVHLPIMCECQRSRNGRCSHDKQVRRCLRLLGE